MPDFKTIADFRKDDGRAIRSVCREFVVLCRGLNLFSEAIVAIDGSKFKAVNNRDKNFTDRKLKARMRQLEESIARYMTELDRTDREPTLVTEARVGHIKVKVAKVKAQMRQLKQIGTQLAKTCTVEADGLELQEIADLIAAGKVEPHVSQTHPLEQAGGR